MTAERVRVGVVGAAGRMGQRLVQAVLATPRFLLVAAVDTPEACARVTLPGLSLASEPRRALAGAQVVIDFSAPPACVTVAPIVAELGAAYLVGSTALGEAEGTALTVAASHVPVLAAANFSIGINALLGLVERAARQLGPTFDIEILELHHARKRDAPSGTALALADAARRGRTELVDVVGRQGTSPGRAPESLGIAALRGGDASGEHSVFFLGTGERVELSHRATTPDIFVAGALEAALFLVGNKPGRYGMQDVLDARAGSSGRA
jgi:4-hydroxy-tetrahydrodipicolinate reductase